MSLTFHLKYVLTRVDMAELLKAIESVFSHRGLVPREKQIEVLSYLFDREHVFVTLPTGFGKSAMFGLFPLVLDQVIYAFCHVLL